MLRPRTHHDAPLRDPPRAAAWYTAAMAMEGGLSLRTRLNLLYTSIFGAALIALYVILFFVLRFALLAGLDNELTLGANILQQGFEKINVRVIAQPLAGDRVKVWLQTPAVRDFEATAVFAQVYQENGDLVGGSPNMTGRLPLDRAKFEAALKGASSQATIVGDGLRLRELVLPLTLDNQVVGVLQVARPMGETERALTLMVYAFVGSGVIVMLAAWRTGAWLTLAAFRPIDQIAETASSIVRAEDLSRRVPVPAAQDEVQRLTVTINELLARLENLFDTQHRLLADISHELRTPLAAMKGNLEVLARGAARDPELLDESLTDMRSEVARLIRMTNDLLVLARSETGLEVRHEPVALDVLLTEVHREIMALADGVSLTIALDEPLTVRGDRDRIKQALLNLGVNAIQHTPAGGRVTLGLERRDAYAALVVSDTGAGIAASDLPRIFDRFYRVDRSRSRNVGGAGLGLAIVRWVADAHQGRVIATSAVGAGSTFALLLPLEASTNHAEPETGSPKTPLLRRGIPGTSNAG